MSCSSLSITEGASPKTMTREVKRLETYIAAQLLCLNGDWQKQSPSLKGNHFARAKFFTTRFYQLLAMPKDSVTTLALRACHGHIFAEAIRIGHGD